MIELIANRRQCCEWTSKRAPGQTRRRTMTRSPRSMPMHGPLPSTPPPRTHSAAFRTREDDDDGDDEDAAAKSHSSSTSRSSSRRFRCFRLKKDDANSLRRLREGVNDGGEDRLRNDVGRRRHDDDDDDGDEEEVEDAASATVVTATSEDDVRRTVRASIERGWMIRPMVDVVFLCVTEAGRNLLSFHVERHTPLP